MEKLQLVNALGNLSKPFLVLYTMCEVIELGTCGGWKGPCIYLVNYGGSQYIIGLRLYNFHIVS